MPTETKPREANRTAELEDRLSEIERQRRQAGDVTRHAEQRIWEITARQQQIAVAVVSEDPEAANENEQLEEALLIETRRAATAKSAAQQLDRLITEAKEAITEERRRGHLKRAGVFARERYALEEEAEEQIAALVQTLGEIKAVDARQRQALSQGGIEQNQQDVLGWNSDLQSWLRTRLGGRAGLIGANPNHQQFATHTLPEFDSLAREDKEV